MHWRKLFYCFFLFIVILSLNITTVLAQDSSRVSLISRFLANWDTISTLVGDNNAYINKIYLKTGTDCISLFESYSENSITPYTDISLNSTIHTFNAGNRRVYVINENHNFEIHIVSGNNQNLRGVIEDFGLASDMVITDSYAFIPRDDSTFVILDISDDYTPSIVSQIPMPGHNFRCSLNNEYIYTGDESGLFYIVDVRNVLNPSIVYANSFNEEILDVEARYSRAIISLRDSGLLLANIFRPDTLQINGSYDRLNNVRRLHLAGTILAVCNSDSGFYRLNIASPDNITIWDTYYGHIYDFIPSDNMFVLNEENKYLTFLYESDTTSLITGYKYGDADVYDLKVNLQHAITYVADAGSGIRDIVTIDPYYLLDCKPRFDVSPKSISMFDSLIAVTTDSDVRLYSKRNYSSTIEYYSTLPISNASKVLINEHFLFISTYDNAFFVYDYSDPSNPYYLAQYQNLQVNGFTVNEGMAILALANSGIKLLDVSDPESGLTTLGNLSLTGDPKDALYYDHHVFIPAGSEGFYLIDIYNPSTPIVINHMDVDSDVLDITIGGCFAYLACGEDGVKVYDISNPNDIHLIGYYDTPGYARNVEAWHENCGVADRDQFLVLRHEDATNHPMDKNNIPSEFIIESVYPNPFNPNCHIKINIPEAGLMSLKVFNTLGQVVSSLSKTPVNAGSFKYQFFGKNHASGLYILQVELEGYGVQSSKMVLMK